MAKTVIFRTSGIWIETILVQFCPKCTFFVTSNYLITRVRISMYYQGTHWTLYSQASLVAIEIEETHGQILNLGENRSKMCTRHSKADLVENEAFLGFYMSCN